MKRYTINDIEEVVNILKNDGAISVPTDTVYGICARINSTKAFNKLVNIKKRPSNKNFPIMCSDIEQIKTIAIVDDKAEKLIRRFMPGPITLVLKKRNDAFLEINNGGERETDELAVRMATSPFLSAVIKSLGRPLFMTSANKSGQDVCKSLDEIEAMCPDLDGMVEGTVSFGESSTIVDCTGKDIKIQREGPISYNQIIEELKNI